MGSIIIIAPPAAGKGTQSKFISKKYHIPHISTGDLLRDEINKKTEIGLKISEIMKSGSLISDQIILEVLYHKIQKLDSYILDGFPRNITQAREYEDMLNKMNKRIDKVFYIDLPKEISKSRILSRISCINCGRVYNTAFEDTQPKEKNICDDCKSQLVKRDDDTEEIFDNRYQVYLDETKPLLDFYNKEHLLYKINGNLDKISIFNEICLVLEGEM